MAKYWAMKTFKEWWEGDFQDKGIVGIDHNGIDDNYITLQRVILMPLLMQTYAMKKLTDYLEISANTWKSEIIF